MLEDDASQRVRSCFTSPPKILPNRSKSLSRATNFPYKISFIRHSPNRLHVGDAAPVTTKATVIRLDRYSSPHPPLFVLQPLDKECCSPNPHSPFFKPLFRLRPSTPTPSNQILGEYGASQSNLWQVQGEPIKSWASIGRANQNAPFRLTEPARPRPWRQREMWRGFVVTPHGCPYTTSNCKIRYRY